MLVLLAGCMLFTSCVVSHSSRESIFNKSEYQNEYELKEIRVPVLIAKIFAKKALKEDGEVYLAQNLKLIKKVRVTTGTTKHSGLISDLKQSGSPRGYAEWVSVKSNSFWMQLSALESANTIRRLKISILDSSDKFILVNMKCKISPQKLSELIQKMISENGKNGAFNIPISTDFAR